MIPSFFNCWPFPSLRTRGVKKLTDFFQKIQSFTQCVSMLYTEKSVLHDYVCSVFADLVNFLAAFATESAVAALLIASSQ